MVLVMLLLLLLVPCLSSSFNVSNDAFMLNGKPFIIRASCFHYFRTHPSDWKDRLLRLMSMGINAVEMYVPWNFHNVSSVVTWSGDRDLPAFLSLLQDLGLLVLLRPGPYICAEWEWGGLPSWLLKDPNLKIRTFNGPYLAAVAAWWAELMPIVRAHLYPRGNIVMVQIENEYGFFGDVEKNPDDLAYMRWLANLTRSYLGNDVIFYTTDPWNVMHRGSLNGEFGAIAIPDFGPDQNPEIAWAEQKQHNAPGRSPRMCSEYYTGWIASWGANMANTSSAAVAQTLDKILSQNGSVSLYMGFGGTNFGFWSGANLDPYVYDIQSYDYNAPVAEDGTHGYGSDGIDKFDAIRSVFAKYSGGGKSFPSEAPPRPATKYGSLAPSGVVSLWGTLATIAQPSLSGVPVYMEFLDQQSGFVLYEFAAEIAAGSSNVLKLPAGSADRISVFVDSALVAIANRGTASLPLQWNSQASGSKLRLLVENMGRVNFGEAMQDEHKGIQGAITLNNVTISQANIYGLSFDNVPKQLSGWGETTTMAPSFFRFSWNITDSTPKDTFLRFDGWSKGVVWVNGFNLGRYWQSSYPQKTLFVSRSLLKSGTNTIVLFEQDQVPVQPITLSFDDHYVFRNSPN